MIRLSVNVLMSAFTLLKWLNDYHFNSLMELAYSKALLINAEDIFDFSDKCGWVSVNDGKPIITQRGNDILKLYKQNSFVDAKRQMLADYVLKISPIWSKRIPYGRSEAAIFMTDDEKACFIETGLISERLDSSIINWWDILATHIRTGSQQTQIDVGRKGEKCTIMYERNRTKCEPRWMAIDCNLLGYDVKSQRSESDSAMLLIEVKSSTYSIDEASFHVSAHEWNVAATSEAYVFHLWCFSGEKKFLAVITPEEIHPFIPTNNLTGVWESAKVPFSSFESKFTEIV